MKIFNKVSVTVWAVVLMIGLTWLVTARAATTPSLGVAAAYGVLASTYTNSSAATTINGGVGFTTAPAATPGGTHTNYGSGAPYSTAGSNQGTALSDLNGQACTFTWGAAVELSTDATHGYAGVYTPGVYCSTGAMSITGSIQLNAAGTYIFRPVGALNTAAGATVTLTGGASVHDVFWTPTGATTLGANTTFVGTVIGNAGITTGADVSWTGRALAFGGTVTTGAAATITVPTPPATPTPTPTQTPTPSPSGGSLAQYNLREGDTISAKGSADPDIYIVNEWGYKRLFLNPIIFNFYGHLGGFSKVKSVSPAARNAFPTSGLFRNCETLDPKVYGVEVTGEDSGILHWINTSGAQAVQDDSEFFKKVFCINSNEFNWYTQGSTYTSVNQVPSYSR